MRNEYRFAFGIWLVAMALTALPSVVFYGLSGGTPSVFILTIPVILAFSLIYAIGPMGLLWPMELTRREKMARRDHCRVGRPGLLWRDLLYVDFFWRDH